MMLTNVGPATERNWSEKDYPGIRNMQIKLWKLVSQVWFVFYSLDFLIVKISPMLMKINFNLIFSEEIAHGLQFLLFYSDGLTLVRFIFQIF